MTWTGGPVVQQTADLALWTSGDFKQRNF